MLRREIYNYLLAYNLVRAAMCDAARITEQEPRKLSSKNAMQVLTEYAVLDSTNDSTVAHVLWSIACNNVGDRPGRKEPRKIKRRRNKYRKMTRPRKEEQEALSLIRAKSGIGVEIGLLGLVHFCSTVSLCFWRHLDSGS